MYRPKYYTITELVNPKLLKEIGEETAWKLFDPTLLKLADEIRRKYGTCTVNGNGLTDCGLRDINSTTGAKYSAHKLGRALDIHIASIEKKWGANKAGKTADYNRVREQLMLDHTFDSLNFEHGISWLHIDTYNRKTRLFNP